MTQKERILQSYGISAQQHIASGMEADVYELNPATVLKLYANTVSLVHLTTLQHFYNALDSAAVTLSLPHIEQITVEDGVVVTIEKRLHGTRLTDHLPSLASGQFELATRNYVAAAQEISHIRVQPDLDRYKLFDEDRHSRRTQGDWHTFLSRQIADKVLSLRPYFARDVTLFSTKLARINQILAQPYLGDYQLIHGDFFPGNLLVDETLKATALLDFGLMTMVGDPLFDIATGWVLFDMYDELNQGVRERLLPIVLEKLGEEVRGRLYRYVLIYSLLSANTYSPTCEDGHYQWCVANLNEDMLWQGVE